MFSMLYTSTSDIEIFRFPLPSEGLGPGLIALLIRTEEELNFNGLSMLVVIVLPPEIGGRVVGRPPSYGLRSSFAWD